MPSLLPGYEYDIFVSYRHNDNRSGWVTEFVKALQEELAATIKEPVSVYFDTNPHDGLLETYNVDKSLEGKLKCLIFIPIISQTYCDPKSFAWQHEFCAFNKLAKEDSFGRDIKLNNGNVASRILPVKIHDLDAEDKATIESETNGVLRTIEFIYKEAGVNRPLAPDDSDAKNVNKTRFKNQVNKVANAIKEIIQAMKPTGSRVTVHEIEASMSQNEPRARNFKKYASVVLGLMLLFALIYGMSQYADSSKSISLDKSIAVLPFVNMSNDPEQEYFSDGITEEIINNLVQIKELKVIGRTSAFQFKGKNIDLRDIGSQLAVAYILEGSIRKSGSQLRITAQLISVSDGVHLWSKSFDTELKDIFKIYDEISHAIANEMKLSLGITPSSPVDLAIYDRYLQARTLLTQRGPGVEQSMALFQQILNQDSTYQPAWTGLAQARLVFPLFTTDSTNKDANHQTAWTKSMEAAQRAVSLNPNDAEAVAAMATVYREQRKYEEAKVNFERALALNDQSPAILEDYVQFLIQVGYTKKAMMFAEKMVDLDPLSWLYQLVYADALLHDGRPQECVEALKRASRLSSGSDILDVTLIFAYLQMNKIDFALQVLETSDLQIGKVWKRQLDAVKNGDRRFDFSQIKNRTTSNISFNGLLLFALNELDQQDLLLEYLESVSLDSTSPITIHSALTPQGLVYHSDRFINDPRMKQVLRNYGLVTFWEKFGWPDRCKSHGNSDFVCN